MLIYNNNKEFIGIDEEDLNALGFSNLSELMAIATDFADLFVKEPGLVHNFNHVSWIDFVECAETTADSKVIIDTKVKTFECQLDVKTAYLTDNPSAKAYLIDIIHLGESSHTKDKKRVDTIVEKPAPSMKTQPAIDIEIPKPEVKDIKEDKSIFEPKPDIEKVVEEKHIDLDIPLDLDFDDTIEEPALPKEEEDTSLEKFDKEYVYDPKIASDELGLPIDLIEEFVEDFIAQAEEFRDELYSSFDNNNIENVKTLSHKLKGVAANLRIEDALESLIIINSSDNKNEIKANLDIFYKIISKLSNKKTEVKKENPSTDSFELEFKEEENEPIKESEVPQEMDILELHDDLLNQDEEKTVEINNAIDIEDISNKDTTEREKESLDTDATEHDIKTNNDDTVDMPNIDIDSKTTYNKKNVAEEIGISYENFLELYEDYINEAKDMSNSISDAIEINNPAIWKNKAKQLKAMCNNMRMDSFIKELDSLIETDDTVVAKEINTSLSKKITNLQG